MNAQAASPSSVGGGRRTLRHLGWVPSAVAGLLLFSAIERINAFTSPVFVTGISPSVDAWFGILLVAAEAALAMSLIVADRDLAILRTTFALFVGFTLYVLISHLVWHRASCGCHAGEQFVRSRPGRFLFSIVRNLIVLLLLGLYMRKIGPGRNRSLDQPGAGTDALAAQRLEEGHAEAS